MTDSPETKIKLLEQKIERVEANMVTRSDLVEIRADKEQSERLRAALEKLAAEIQSLVNHSVRTEERHKNFESALDRAFSKIEESQTESREMNKSIRRIELYIAADEPYKLGRSVVVKGVITFIVAGILAAAFTLSN